VKLRSNNFNGKFNRAKSKLKAADIFNEDLKLTKTKIDSEGNIIEAVKQAGGFSDVAVRQRVPGKFRAGRDKRINKISGDSKAARNNL
jgi:hypothetical protein